MIFIKIQFVYKTEIYLQVCKKPVNSSFCNLKIKNLLFLQPSAEKEWFVISNYTTKGFKRINILKFTYFFCCFLNIYLLTNVVNIINKKSDYIEPHFILEIISFCEGITIFMYATSVLSDL